MLYSLMAASRVYLIETKGRVLSCFVGQHMLDYVFNKKKEKKKHSILTVSLNYASLIQQAEDHNLETLNLDMSTK